MSRDNPLVSNFNELLSKIKEDLKEDKVFTGLYIAKDSEDSLLEELLVQPLVRKINGKEVTFLSIRNVVLKEQYKGKKLFTDFVQELESLKTPLIFHDIVNDKLLPFFGGRGYKMHKEKKYEQEVVSMYRLN